MYLIELSTSPVKLFHQHIDGIKQSHIYTYISLRLSWTAVVTETIRILFQKSSDVLYSYRGQLAQSKNKAFPSWMLKDGCVRFKEDAILCSIFGCELAEQSWWCSCAVWLPGYSLANQNQCQRFLSNSVGGCSKWSYFLWWESHALKKKKMFRKMESFAVCPAHKLGDYILI